MALNQRPLHGERDEDQVRSRPPCQLLALTGQGDDFRRAGLQVLAPRAVPNEDVAASGTRLHTLGNHDYGHPRPAQRLSTRDPFVALTRTRERRVLEPLTDPTTRTIGNGVRGARTVG